MCVAIVLRIDLGAREKAERPVRRLAIVQVMGTEAIVIREKQSDSKCVL